MLIDCDRCEMRDIACPDCVVTALLGPASRSPTWTRRSSARSACWPTPGWSSPLRLRPVARAS